MKQKTLEEFKEMTRQNADALFVKTKMYGQIVDLPISQVPNKKEQERHITEFAQRQFKAQKKKFATSVADPS